VEELKRIVSGLHRALDAHTAADERASHHLNRELESVRKALEQNGALIANLVQSVSMLTERSSQHERMLRSHELVMGTSALLLLAAKLAHWI
jgi:hypothetical protein